jgi:hypothetical protein
MDFDAGNGYVRCFRKSFAVACEQGDQMSLWKNRQNFKSMYNFFSGKKWPQNLNYFCFF